MSESSDTLTPPPGRPVDAGYQLQWGDDIPTDFSFSSIEGLPTAEEPSLLDPGNYQASPDAPPLQDWAPGLPSTPPSAPVESPNLDLTLIGPTPSDTPASDRAATGGTISLDSPSAGNAIATVPPPQASRPGVYRNIATAPVPAMSFGDASAMGGGLSEQLLQAYTDPEFRRQVASRSPIISEYAGLGRDPDLTAKESLNRALINRLAQHDASETEYQIWRARLGRQYMGKENPTTEELFGIGEEISTTFLARNAAFSHLDDTTVADLMARANGQTALLSPRNFNEFLQKNEGAFRGVPAEQLWPLYVQRIQQAQSQFGPSAAKARKVWDYLQPVLKARENGGSRVASLYSGSFDPIGDALIDETPEGRAAIRAMIEAQARADGLDPKTFATMLAESFTRSLADIGSGGGLLGTELTVKKRMDLIKSGMGRVRPGQAPSLAGLLMPAGMGDAPGSADPATQQLEGFVETGLWLKGRELAEPEKTTLLAEGDRIMKKIRIIREFRQMAKGVDPVKPTMGGWGGAGQNAAFWLAGSAPYFAASAIPYVGLPAVGVSMAVTNAEQIRSEHPDEDPGLALVKGGAISALQMLPMTLSLGMLGRLPLTGAWLRRLEREPISTFGAVQQKLARGGLFVGEQALQAEAGAAAPLAIKVLAAKLQGDDPSVEWERELSIFNESQPETLGQIVPWFLFAKGYAGIKAIPGALRTIRTEGFLADLELPREKLEAITQAPTDEAAAASLRQTLAAFTSQQWQALAGHYDATVSHLRSRLGASGFPGLRHEVDGQGKTTFTILDGEGQPVASADNPTLAAHLFEMQGEQEKAARSEVNGQPSSDAQMPIAASGDGEVLSASTKEANDLTKIPEPDISKFDVRGAEPVSGKEAEQAIARLNGVLVQPHFGYTVRSVDPQGGDLHSSQRTGSAALAREIAKIFGRRVVLFETASGKSLPNALVLTGEQRYIFLHNRASKPHMLLMGHELYHHIEVSAPELAADIRATLDPLVRNHDVLSRSKAPYPENRRFDEVVADLFGDFLSNRNFWDRLNEKNPSAFTKIATVVKQWLDKVAAALQAKGFQSYRHFTDIKKAQDVVANALAKFAEKPFNEPSRSRSNSSKPEMNMSSSKLVEGPAMDLYESRPIASEVSGDYGAHKLASPRGEAYMSKDDKARDPASILQDLLRGSGGAAQGQRRKHGRELSSGASLMAWADLHGRNYRPDYFALPSSFEGGGGEHAVVHDPNSGRIFKLTKPGLFGAQAGDAGKYLERWALSNRVFGDDVKVEGTVHLPGEDDRRLVISQPFVKGRDATGKEQEDFLKGKGFVEVDGKWVHPIMGVSVWDTQTPGNVIVSPDGKYHAVDLQIGPAAAEELKAAREKSGIGGDLMFSK